MNEITINPLTHAIITYSKSHYLINAEQNEKLKQLDGSSLLDIDGSQIAVRNIAEIMSIKKYYETYPDRKPQIKVNQFEKYESVIQQPIGRNGLASMIKGLKRFIDESDVKGVKTPKAQMEFDRLVKKYEHQYGKA